MEPRRRRFLAPIVWAFVVGVASVTPPTVLGPPTTGGRSGILGLLPADLVFHLVGYTILTAFLVRAGLTVSIAVFGATAFGAGIETIQFVLPYRHASLLDALVNVAGGATGAALADYWTDSE